MPTNLESIETDYKVLIKAVVDNAITDYVKLQHPKNRDKKYLKEGFLTSVDMFFDPDYRFLSFVSQETNANLTTEELLKIMIDSNKVSLQKTKDHIIKKSIDYWWEKSFHNLKVPSKVIIMGKVWFTHNAKVLKVNYKKNHIYLPIKNNGSDKLFYTAVLQIILSEIDLQILDEDFDNLLKAFYLFLKVNNAFSN